MTLEQYAYLAEIIGVIIVVVTLVYLSLQVRQGANLMRSEARQALMNNTRGQVLAYLDNVDLFDKMADEEKLSPADQMRFSSLWILNMRNREHEWFQYKDGIQRELNHRGRPLNYFIYPYVEVNGVRHDGSIETSFSYREL